MAELIGEPDIAERRRVLDILRAEEIVLCHAPDRADAEPLLHRRRGMQGREAAPWPLRGNGGHAFLERVVCIARPPAFLLDASFARATRRPQCDFAMRQQKKFAAS